MPDIIIVEDNREIGTLLCDFLRKENYTVSLVDTGEKALQIFEQYGANLVVIDIGLPGVDGYSVCSKIREASNAHIMIATARDDKESTLKGLQIGADDGIGRHAAGSHHGLPPAAAGSLHGTGHQLVADGAGEISGQSGSVQRLALLPGVVRQIHHGGLQPRKAHVQLRPVHMGPG